LARSHDLEILFLCINVAALSTVSRTQTVSSDASGETAFAIFNRTLLPNN
jgi:hypothetical protein